MNPVHYSSKTPVWETPQDFFDDLNSRYRFDLDVCALPENAKCAKFFTPEIDGLAQDWSGHTCWMNPPYGREIGKWVEKAAMSQTIVVGLLPARTDTRWFHDWVLGVADVTFLRGRLKFGGAASAAPFPSLVAVWGRK